MRGLIGTAAQCSHGFGKHGRDSGTGSAHTQTIEGEKELYGEYSSTRKAKTWSPVLARRSRSRRASSACPRSTAARGPHGAPREPFLQMQDIESPCSKGSSSSADTTWQKHRARGRENRRRLVAEKLVDKDRRFELGRAGHLDQRSPVLATRAATAKPAACCEALLLTGRRSGQARVPRRGRRGVARTRRGVSSRASNSPKTSPVCTPRGHRTSRGG